MGWGGEQGDTIREQLRIKLAHLKQAQYTIVRDMVELTNKLKHDEKRAELMAAYDKLYTPIETTLNR